MPPYDPWFAGGYLTYSYFGQFMTATMFRWTGIIPSVAYTLAVPMFFAMTVGGAFTVVHGLVERVQLRPGMVRASAASAVIAGLTGALFVTVIGNMDGLFQVCLLYIADAAGDSLRVALCVIPLLHKQKIQDNNGLADEVVS